MDSVRYFASMKGHHSNRKRNIPKMCFRSSVRLGEYDLSTDVDCYNGMCIDKPVDIKVEKLIPHESYAPGSKSQENDIALVRLSRPVKYTSNFCEQE